MSRRARRTAAPETAEYQPGQYLDWGNPSHWSDIELPCRYCAEPTHLRDSKRLPAHKVCAEQALAVQHEQAMAAYTNSGPS